MSEFLILNQAIPNTDIKEKALTPWGYRDSRDGYLSPFVQSQTEIFINQKPQQGINFSKYSNIPVSISEKHLVLSRFEDSKVHQILFDNISLFGYTHPTPIQRYAIPVILSGKDLMACAETGSGKTLAYMYPLIAKMIEDGPPSFSNSPAARPAALVIAPTRELAIQIYQEALKLAYKTGIISFCAYGGTSVELQISQILQGVDILIGTPGRIIDLSERGSLDLESIKYLILDEADRMLDMGFEPQLIKILDFIKKPNRQTTMCSATFPQEIQTIAQKYLKNYIYLAIGRVGSTTENILQKFFSVNNRGKLSHLITILSENLYSKTLSNIYIVFVETKKSTEIVTIYLKKQGKSVCCIHGDKRQYEREKSLNDFKNGKCAILVATDVAARGLDIQGVECVIVYDMPNNIESYVHRIGRTGRIGNKGLAITFIDDRTKPVILELCRLLEETRQDVPVWLRDMNSELPDHCKDAFKENNSRYGPFGDDFENVPLEYQEWYKDPPSWPTEVCNSDFGLGWEDKENVRNDE